MVNDRLVALKPNEIRGILRQWVSQNFSLKAGDVLINELGFVNKDPKSTVDSTFRADLAVANGRLVGFEIKSELDTLKRWIIQMEAYSKVFDEVWLCSHGKHIAKALEVTPSHIGIMVVDDLSSLAVIRKPSINHHLRAYDLSGLLWRDEINELCRIHHIKITSRANKREAREVLAKALPLDIIKGFTLERLKTRERAAAI